MPIPHTIRHCSLLVAMVLVACEKPSEAPEQSNTAAQSAATTPCTRSLNIFLAPLQDEAATATLRFAKDAKGDLQCADVNIGEKAVRLMPGESTTISTHATDLQRIYIRKQRLLVYIAPGSTIEFGGNPDHEWELRDERFVAGQNAIPGQITLTAPSDWPLPITVESPPEEAVRFPSSAEPPLALVPSPFPNVRVNTGDERVQLAVGNGENWALEVNSDGGLTGSLK